ncbi:transcription antitermination factor NusB [Paenimyroides ceti]
MINRRHIRIKVMQTIYAMQQNSSDLMDSNEKFLMYSIENIRDLYLLMLSSLIEIQKQEGNFLEVSSRKHLATAQERTPNKKFINNHVLQLLVNSNQLNEMIHQEKINHFEVNDHYIKNLLDEIKKSDIYKKYMINNRNTFEEDRELVSYIFTEIVAPSEKIYEFLEDTKLTWIDDIPLVNTAIQKELKQIKEDTVEYRVAKIYKDMEDKEFARQLFRKTMLNAKELSLAYYDKTKNWDIDRIAELDAILLNMSVCELLKFPSIPVKVTINEYLEIAKEYSTPKSSIFINGILDALVKEYKQEDKLNKVGRGLIE